MADIVITKHSVVQILYALMMDIAIINARKIVEVWVL
jgi:hypothetical protein